MTSRSARRGALALSSILALVLGPVQVPANAAAGHPGAVHPIESTAATQVVVVSAASYGTSGAVFTAYRWHTDRWVAEIGPVAAGIGANGFTDTPSEADGFTPVGSYEVTTLFGAAPDPGTHFAYRQTTSNDHWVDDPTSPVYNTWQTGPADGRWQSAETLSAYEYAVAFDFNQWPVVPGGNSAIFLHEGGGATPGCIGVARATLLRLMQWLDPAAHPRIILGVDVAPPMHVTSTSGIEATGPLRRWLARHPEWGTFA